MDKFYKICIFMSAFQNSNEDYTYAFIYNNNHKHTHTNRNSCFILNLHSRPIIKIGTTYKCSICNAKNRCTCKYVTGVGNSTERYSN